MQIKIWDGDNNLELDKKVKHVGHFGVVRDYTLTMEDNSVLEISADIVSAIVEHENRENNE